VDIYKEGVLFGRVVIGRVEQPALDVKAIVLPLDGFGFAPGGFLVGVEMADLDEAVFGATRDEDLGRAAEAAGDECVGSGLSHGEDIISGGDGLLVGFAGVGEGSEGLDVIGGDDIATAAVGYVADGSWAGPL
jgi:hypothetical protein